MKPKMRRPTMKHDRGDGEAVPNYLTFSIALCGVLMLVACLWLFIWSVVP